MNKSSTSNITKLSEEASFSVESSAISKDMKKISFFYADVEKKYGSLMLETWPPDADIRKEPMTYDDQKKGGLLI